MAGSHESGPTDSATVWEAVSEDELAALALAADPASPVDADAVPLDEFLGRQPGLLPAWYMPRPASHAGSKWRTAVVLGVVAAFVVLEALGLCSIFGQVVVG